VGILIAIYKNNVIITLLMKVHDLVFIPHNTYLQIVTDYHSLTTKELESLMGIKYYSTEFDPIETNDDTKKYVFEVNDQKKLMLFKFKYSF